MCQSRSNKNTRVVYNLLILTCVSSGLHNMHYTHKKIVSNSPLDQGKKKKIKIRNQLFKKKCFVPHPQ